MIREISLTMIVKVLYQYIHKQIHISFSWQTAVINSEHVRKELSKIKEINECTKIASVFFIVRTENLPPNEHRIPSSEDT